MPRTFQIARGVIILAAVAIAPQATVVTTQGRGAATIAPQRTFQNIGILAPFVSGPTTLEP